MGCSVSLGVRRSHLIINSPCTLAATISPCCGLALHISDKSLCHIKKTAG
ncbi:hypothetical protein F4826_000597 [Rahnella inusitata]|nr:hypothetical protein [Rahnella inusitata]